MNEKYFLTIDQGTSATKAIIFNNKGQLVNRCDTVHRQYYPNPGWVEHDPIEIYEKTLEAIRLVMDQTDISYHDLYCISISNQRETAVVWDKTTGIPICPAIVWQCNRAEKICKDIVDQGKAELIRRKTGLVLSPYFSAAKVSWILKNVEGAKEKANRGDLLFGNIDSWLIWNLSGGKVHATDFSNASRTQLFNLFDLTWDPELLSIFGIPESMMPEVISSDQIFGQTEGVFSHPVPVAGVLGDSHAAFFGQCCFCKGMAKSTFGTGSSVMMNIGNEPITTHGGVVTSIGYARNNKVTYVLEGNINCTGATIKWLVDDLELIQNARESGEIAARVPDNQGVYLVPAFVGLSAPYWDSDARAAILNLTRGSKKAHVVRAAEESIAYQIKDIIENMLSEASVDLQEVRVDGGPTRDDFLMQFLSDMLEVPVIRSKTEELSATGAMYMGGLALGIWNCYEDLEAMRQVEKSFISQMSDDIRQKNYEGWKRAVAKVLTNCS